jgi:predicted homoserine dehydrogenase-like protein
MTGKMKNVERDMKLGAIIELRLYTYGTVYSICNNGAPVGRPL